MTLATSAETGSPAANPVRPRVLLLHGFLAGRATWQPVQRELAEDVETVAPDLPAYGRAPAVRGERTLDAVVDALAAVADRERVTHVVGYSMGGVIALGLGARYPARFASVGVACMPVFANSRQGLAHFGRKGPLYRLFLGRGDLTHGVCVALNRTRGLWSRPAHPLLARDLPLDVFRTFFDHRAQGHRAFAHDIIFGGAAEPLAAKVPVPVAALHGTNDGAAPLAPLRDVAGRHGWQLDVVRGGGHQIVVSHPGLVAHWIRERVIGAGAEAVSRPQSRG